MKQITEETTSSLRAVKKDGKSKTPARDSQVGSKKSRNIGAAGPREQAFTQNVHQGYNSELNSESRQYKLGSV